MCHNTYILLAKSIAVFPFRPLNPIFPGQVWVSYPKHHVPHVSIYEKDNLEVDLETYPGVN
jgi:hypothetical protein